MKRIVCLVLGVLLIAGVVAYAESAKTTLVTKQVMTTTTGVATPEMLDKKKAELNGTQWTIELKPMSGGKARVETDVISFADNKIVSANLEKSGFGPTNFTVRMEDDGTLIWETMQSSEKMGMAFWRGDVKDGVMRGVLSKRDKKNVAYDYNFVSVTR